MAWNICLLSNKTGGILYSYELERKNKMEETETILPNQFSTISNFDLLFCYYYSNY